MSRVYPEVQYDPLVRAEHLRSVEMEMAESLQGLIDRYGLTAVEVLEILNHMVETGICKVKAASPPASPSLW